MKKHIPAVLWVLAFLSLPVYAFANNFLTNGVVASTGQVLPGTKINAPNPPNVPANEQVTATEFNTVTGALDDIRTFLLPVTGFVDAGLNLATNPTQSLTADSGFFGSIQATTVNADGGSFGSVNAAAYTYASNADPRTANNGIVYSVSQVGDFDSLVSGWIGGREYQNQCGFYPEFTVAAGSPVPGSSFISAVDMNPGGSATQWLSEARFSLPPGASGAKITAYLQKGGADTGTTGVGFSNISCGTLPGGLGAVLDGGMNAYSWTIADAGWTQHTDFYGGLYGNNVSYYGASATSDPIVGAIQIQPTYWDGGSPSGVFAGDWWRVGAGPTTLWSNNRDYYLSTGVFWSSPQAYMVIDTDATTIAVESTNGTNGTSVEYNIGVLVNGQPYTQLAPIASVSQYYSVALPTGTKEVTIKASTQQQSFANIPDDHEGNFIDAVFVPANATTYVKGPPPRRSVVIYGDSMPGGTQGTTAYSLTAVPQLLGKWTNSYVTLEAADSKSLASSIGDGGGNVSGTNLENVVTYLANTNPTDVYLQMGYNDYNNSGSAYYFSTLGQFAAAYGALLDAVHQRIPLANIWAQSMLITGHEGTAVNGFTPPNYRTQVSNACAARSWCNFIDGTTLLAAGDIEVSTGIHPLAWAHSKWARNIISKIDNPSTSNPTGWASTNDVTADAGLFFDVTADAGFFGTTKATTASADGGYFATLTVLGSAGMTQAAIGNGGSVLSNVGVGTCNLASGTCNAAVPGASGSSLCYCGIQGTYARDAGSVTCSAQADAGSATCYCYYAALAIDPAPAPVGIHCDN